MMKSRTPVKEDFKQFLYLLLLASTSGMVSTRKVKALAKKSKSNPRKYSNVELELSAEELIEKITNEGFYV